jgi:hypothetical protein
MHLKYTKSVILTPEGQNGSKCQKKEKREITPYLEELDDFSVGLKSSRWSKRKVEHFAQIS